MKQWISKANVIRLIGVLCSAVLLAASFPPLGESQAAWLGVMPLILVARSTSPGRAFYWGWASGTLFWLVSMAWLWHLGATGCSFVMAGLAWLALAICLALFRGAFAATTAWAFKVLDAGPRDGEQAPFSRTLPMVLIVPLLWVGFEYLRGVIGSGLPWNGLGISQYRNLPVLQLAEWGGVPLVSGVIVAANTGIALMLARVSGVYMGARRVRVQLELMVVLLLMAVVWTGGVRRVRALRATAGSELSPLRVVAIQPNIPQLKKWPEAFESEIYGALEERMDLVTALQAEIDLVIWPETALPGFLPDDSAVDTFVRQLARETGTPLLVGAMEIGGRHPGGDPEDESMVMRPWDWILHNSTFLYAGDGTLVGRYRKQHLVPFGEYLPMDQHWRWVRRLAPLGFCCTPGKESTVFNVETPVGATIPFSSLICFEDVFAGVARDMVRNGARLLVNQTNDGWFDGSAAAVQHMSHCVFRCVENRVPAVRAANTGVTCFIDRTGQIDETSRGILKRKEWALIDYRSEIVAVPRDDMVPTFYTRFGDWPLAIPAAIVALVASLMTWRQSKKDTTL
ncbi:MAG: apolipoprotein N-acyltransferase [Verrucomicrobia bacterium]|jgi:apolipoprotein N-acyltransferase|nr:apolipoprotein N-acyltransferase [Verrucomicrobiota bacterium]MBT7064729.1 apolipoprotein N-acyltransferase [Verrucomicrobiota bacterium]MBT7700169.1 apolipoprotein N-acyltransferase [Verrucomicrobiota bacterium]